jgi:hypothetical protein
MSLISAFQFIIHKRVFLAFSYFPFYTHTWTELPPTTKSEKEKSFTSNRIFSIEIFLGFIEKGTTKNSPKFHVRHSLPDTLTTTDGNEEEIRRTWGKSKQTPAQLILDRFSTKSRDIFPQP